MTTGSGTKVAGLVEAINTGAGGKHVYRYSSGWLRRFNQDSNIVAKFVHIQKQPGGGARLHTGVGDTFRQPSPIAVDAFRAKGDSHRYYQP